MVVAASVVILIGSTQERAFAATTPNANSVIAGLVSRTAAISTYTVNLTARVRMRTFPFFGATFHGNASYQRPGTFSVSLNNAALAKHYQAAMENMGDPSTWLRDYDAAVDSDHVVADGVLVLRLQPKVRGDIEYTLAYVRLATMTVDQIDWHYACGGRIEMKQHYAPVGSILMVSRQDIDIAMPDAKVLARTSLENYSIRTELGSAISDAPARAGW